MLTFKERMLSAFAILVFITLLFFSSPASAQVPPTVSFKINWVQSTGYTDGSTLPANEIIGNRVAWGTCNGVTFGTKLGEHKLAPSITDTITGLAAGTYCIQVYTTAQKSGLTATESEPTAPYSISAALAPTPKPNPPSRLTVDCVNAGTTWVCTVQ